MLSTTTTFLPRFFFERTNLRPQRSPSGYRWTRLLNAKKNSVPVLHPTEDAQNKQCGKNPPTGWGFRATTGAISCKNSCSFAAFFLHRHIKFQHFSASRMVRPPCGSRQRTYIALPRIGWMGSTALWFRCVKNDLWRVSACLGTAFLSPPNLHVSAFQNRVQSIQLGSRPRPFL